MTAQNLAGSELLGGPSFLKEVTPGEVDAGTYAVEEDDPEVQKITLSLKTQITGRSGLGSQRFSRFPDLSYLLRAIAKLIVAYSCYQGV